jgi:transposase-like protein
MRFNWLSRLWQRRRGPPSLTDCPACGREMVLVERTSFTGDDMRSYRCEHCRREHIVNFGPALWKVLSDAREEAEKDR